MTTGNIGEWSEIYTLFKLLGDRQLVPGNKNIEKLEGIVYPILKILRAEKNGDFEYSIQDEIILISGGKEVLKIHLDEFKSKADDLLKIIRQNKKRTFPAPQIEEFMQSINCMSLKASSTTKTDITIIIHDQKTSQQPTLGFSIKSQLGGASTLLNAGKTTNFIFEITGVNYTQGEITTLNSISTRNKIRDRVDLIIRQNGNLQFVKTEKQIFSNNLVLIDSKLPEILSELVSEFYSSNKSTVPDLVSRIASRNPLQYDNSNEHQFYEYKIKRFLSDVALGMMPSLVWSGHYDATGGYLIVKENGEILCYHLYNRNEFEDYLFNNTKLETASSTRHQFGTIFKDGERIFIKLNLQIRFIK